MDSNTTRTRRKTPPRLHKPPPNDRGPCKAKWRPSPPETPPDGRTIACRRLRRPRREPARGSGALRRWSWQLEVACERREKPFHLRRAHRCERGRLPTRRLGLVDDHGADPFVAVVSPHHARDYAEFGT